MEVTFTIITDFKANPAIFGIKGLTFKDVLREDDGEITRILRLVNAYLDGDEVIVYSKDVALIDVKKVVEKLGATGGENGAQDLERLVTKVVEEVQSEMTGIWPMSSLVKRVVAEIKAQSGSGGSLVSQPDVAESSLAPQPADISKPA